MTSEQGKHCPACGMPDSVDGLVRKIEAMSVELEEARSSTAGLEQARRKLEGIGDLLSDNGCECDCDHSIYDHDDDCERCLGCRIDAVLGER